MNRNILLALAIAAASVTLGGASGCDKSINDDDVTIAVTTRASISTFVVEGNDSSTSAVISGNGGFIAFTSVSTTLVSNAVSGISNVYVRDINSGITELISVTSGGSGGSAASFSPSISSDGRYVVFVSQATDLVAGLDDNLANDIFMRDRQAGTTVRISQTSVGGVGNFGSVKPRISPDGRYIVFESSATNLEGTPDTNNSPDIFLWDQTAAVMERVSLTAAGGIPAAGSFSPGVSADGRYIVYHSGAVDMVTGDLGVAVDVFIRDRQLARTERVSVAFPFGDPNADSFDASISHDGRYVAFASEASNLVSGTDVNGQSDIFIRDLVTLTTQVVSRSTSGALGFGESSEPRISGDGRRVVFQSDAPNLVDGDTNGSIDIFVRDLLSGVTQRVSVRTFGVQASDQENSSSPSISTDGRTVAFESRSEDLVDDDSNGVSDVFIRTPLP